MIRISLLLKFDDTGCQLASAATPAKAAGVAILVFLLCTQQHWTDAVFQEFLFVQETVHLQELGHQPGPAGLVTGPHTRAIIAMKKFIEQDVVAPVWVILEFIRTALDRATSLIITHKYPCQSSRDLHGHLEEIHVIA